MLSIFVFSSLSAFLSFLIRVLSASGQTAAWKQTRKTTVSRGAGSQFLLQLIVVLLELVIGHSQLPYLSLCVGLRGSHLVALDSRLLFLLDQRIYSMLVHAITLPQTFDLAHQLLDGFRGAEFCS